MTEGTYYKKIVEYKKNKESNMILGFGLILLGMSMGFMLSPPPVVNYFLPSLTLFLASIGCIIGNFYITHDRKVKYEKIEVKRI